MRITRHLHVIGRVQGVFFRESMRREAIQRGVSGWVRNRPDGTVEAVLQGETSQVEALITWARRGPSAAQVLNIEVSEAQGTFEGFENRPTA